MKRLIPVLGLVLLLTPLSAPAQYPPGGGYNDMPEQMVAGWYRQFLGRVPDGQSAVWIDAIKSGQAPEAVLAQILGSTEYYMRGGGSAQGFVRRLHTDLTGRPPGAAETRAWLNRLYQSDRQDLAYHMLRRYPQGLGAGAPQEDYGAEPPLEYRRPLNRYYDR